MQHLQNALVSRYIMELHKPFFMEKGIAPGPAGMRRVIQRLCKRIKEANTGLSDYVCESFLRAFAGLNSGSAFRKIKWGLTGAEQRQLFLVLPFCLENLV